MSRCWVEFREQEVPNTWNPHLVGTQFRPKRKPRYFGSVPTIRCVSSNQGLKCFRRNSINKRWYSLSPARTCGSMFARKGPRSAKAYLEVRGQRAPSNFQRSLNADDGACREECIGSMTPGMKVPSEYEAHILDHMRCSCSACMNFACQWRRALKDEFRQVAKDPLAPKRKPKRWMPVLERHKTPERAPFHGRPDRRSQCRRAPRVSWWYGNYSPSSDSGDNVLKPELLDMEQRQRDNCEHLSRSKQRVADSTADGFEDVAMDGTTLPSRLTYRTQKLPRDASACRDSAARCFSRSATSFNRPECTRRNRVAQGVLNDEDEPVAPEVNEVEAENSHGFTTRNTPTKYTCLSDDTWNKESTYEDKTQDLFNDRDGHRRSSEPEKCQSFKSRNLLYSDRTANKYSPYRNHLRSSVRKCQDVINDDTVVNHCYAQHGNRCRDTFSERADAQCERGHDYSNLNEESCAELHYPISSKYAHDNREIKRDRYQHHYNKMLSEKYSLDTEPNVNANLTSHRSRSGSFSHADESSDSCNNSKHRYCGRRFRSFADRPYLHRHQHCPAHQHHSPSHFHDDEVWDYSHHSNWRTSDMEHPTEIPRYLPKNSRSDSVSTEENKRIYYKQPICNRSKDAVSPYSVSTEKNSGIYHNKNICNRSKAGDSSFARSSAQKHIRREDNIHLGTSEKSPKTDTEVSSESEESIKSRSPRKMCKRWTTLSPSRFNIYPSKTQSVNAREFNDNENRGTTESPQGLHSGWERLRNADKRDDGKHCAPTSSATRRKQHYLNSDSSPLPAESSQESDNNIDKRQRICSVSPLGTIRPRTSGCSRRSRSRSRRKEDNNISLVSGTKQMLDTTQSNSACTPRSPLKHGLDTKPIAFGPAERVMREARPKSRPEWLNKHLSLMTECSQEQQNNAKSRMTRIVDKTNALSRSTGYMKLDFNHLKERLDRVKDLQQNYFERAEEAIKRMKNRDRTYLKSRLDTDGSQNAGETHHRFSDSGFREEAAVHLSHRRRAKDASEREKRAKRSSTSVEPGRLCGWEDGNKERHRGRTAHSEVSSDLGAGDTSKTAESGTDSGSEPEN
ncbi:hypothetical protein BsWGS_09103 [Bradybaena similaris]